MDLPQAAPHHICLKFCGGGGACLFHSTATLLPAEVPRLLLSFLVGQSALRPARLSVRRHSLSWRTHPVLTGPWMTLVPSRFPKWVFGEVSFSLYPPSINLVPKDGRLHLGGANKK